MSEDNWEALLEDEKDIVVKKEGENFEAEVIVDNEKPAPKPVPKDNEADKKAPKDKKKKPVTTTVTNEPARPLNNKEKEELERYINKTDQSQPAERYRIDVRS